VALKIEIKLVNQGDISITYWFGSILEYLYVCPVGDLEHFFPNSWDDDPI
jgi:hypothetical protein